MRDLKLFKAIRRDDDSISRIEPGFNNAAESLSNTNNLVQRVLKTMLTQRGSNKYHPNFGTSINDLIRTSTNTNLNNQKEIEVILNLVVSQTQDQIIDDQNNYTNLTLSELLDKIVVIGITYNETNNNWKFKLAIYNQNNQVSIMEI